MELSAEQIAKIAGQVASVMKADNEKAIKAAVDAAVAAAAEAQKTAIEAATKPLTEKIAALEAKPGKGKSKKGKADDDEEDDETDPILAKLTGAIEAANKPLLEKITALEAKDSASAAASSKSALIDATLKTKYPNLKDKQREVVVRRLSAQDLKDAAAVDKAMGELKEEYGALGHDVTPFSVTVASEGGNPGVKDEKADFIANLAKTARGGL